MDGRMLVFVIAIASSFLLAVVACRAGAESFLRRRAVLAAQGEAASVANLVAWRLRNGYPIALPLARVALASKRVRQTVEEASALLARRGVAADAEPLLTVLLCGLVVAAVVVGLFTRSAVASCVAVVCLAVVFAIVMEGSRERRYEAMRDCVAPALESMSACFGSGFTLQQTFDQVSHDVGGPLGEVFSRSSHILEMGGGAQRALAELRKGSNATELAFVAVALDVQHQSGGSMRKVLEAASQTVRSEIDLKRSLRTQTAQAKLSARIVAAMPFVLVGVFSLLSPDFLTPFFSSAQGYALLALALLMLGSGIMLVRRALTVEGLS